jgi:Fe-S-cluster-containing hydrogenase component 2
MLRGLRCFACKRCEPACPSATFHSPTNAAAAADLPALQAVGQDLQADAGLVAASVAIYMLTVGLGSLFWGPMVGGC